MRALSRLHHRLSMCQIAGRPGRRKERELFVRAIRLPLKPHAPIPFNRFLRPDLMSPATAH